MAVDYNIVLGCPRSGTSFLMKVLDTLPETECVTGNLVPIVVPHIVNHEMPPNIRSALQIGVAHSLNGYLGSGAFNSRSAALRKWVSDRTGPAGLWKALKGVRKIRRVVYKEPFLAFAPEFIFEALPDVRIIHIYRDGRDAADSMVRTYDVLTDEKLTSLRTNEALLGRKWDHRYVPWWVEEGREVEFLAAAPYVRSIWMWKAMVGRCAAFFSRPDIQASGRVFLLRYESLVTEPLVFGRNAVEHFAGGMPDSKTLMRRLGSARPNSIGIHRRRSGAEICEAERVAGAELKLYGYM